MYLDHECSRQSVPWWYTHVPNMVSQCQSKKSYGLDTKTSQKPYTFDFKVNVQGQRSRSYLDHECTRHVVSWWYTPVPNIVSQCQTKKKLGRTRISSVQRTDLQTEWFLYTLLNFAHGGYKYCWLTPLCSIFLLQFLATTLYMYFSNCESNNWFIE